HAPPLPVYIPYVPELEYPEYIPPKDEVFPAEEQPLPAAASPTTDSPGYIPESDLDEDLEDDDDEEEDPSGDDADEEDEEQDEDDDDEEEQHPASADSIPPPPALLAAVARPIEGRRVEYGFVGSVEAEIRRRIAKDIGYGIRDTWIDPRDVAEEEVLTTLEGVNTMVTELAVVQEQDT
nr:hypothetical protein [Tanacetum cinerariifolium]